MKKRLLFAFMAMFAAVSGYALEQFEFVYTPQGRFQITGANLNANNAFQDMTGWTAVSAAEKTLTDLFNINANGLAEGFNSVASLDATAGEGMYYKFVPTSASESYVVSFKMKGTPQTSVRTRLTVWDGNNPSKEVSVAKVVRVQGNSANTFGATEDEIVVNTAEEMTEEWATYNYAIVGDGIARTYFISFTGMPTTTEIADLQIAPAMQFADLRQRDAMLEKLKAYKDCYDWKEGVLDEYAMNEAIENLQAIGDESGQADLDEVLVTAQEILGEFIKANMDDYLAGNEANYLGIRTASGNLQKQSKLGDWTCVDRGFWSSGAYPDLGHYQSGNTWSNGNPNNAMGVTIQKVLDPGSYVFAIEGNAAFREADVSKTWTNDDGMKPAYGIAYIAKVVEGADPVIIESIQKDLDPVKFTPFCCVTQITEAGNYEFGFKAYCKDEYKTIKFGSVTYVKDASIWGKNENVYNQKQLTYEADVREQITTGRTNLTTAKDNIANAEYLWGKAELQDCVDTVETKIAAYELLDQDAIIATYNSYIEENGEDSYTKSTSDPAGIMVYEVYQEAVKDIIAANRKFTAVNDTLNSIQVAIDAAEATLALRVYDAATGKAALQSAINTAKDVQTQMKATQYSEENAAAIVAAIATLNEAVETFKTTIPAEAIATIVDIDFENDAVQDAETQSYSIAGAAGAMEFTHFSTIAPEGEDAPYQQGHWDNGEQKWKGYLRIGNGDGTVAFNPVAKGKEDMGTNILKVSCDFYIQGLSNRSVGFFLKDEADVTLAALYRNYYQPSDTENTFGADMSKVWAKSGGAYNDASPADAEEPTATVIEKTNFEVIMDYGRKSMYCNISSSNGSTTSQEVALAGIPAKFVLSCNYDNKFATRRCWFDNLKIQRITAGETEPFVPSAIDTVKANTEKAEGIYNLAGQKVSKSFKGLVIINGKKYIMK